MAPTLSDRSAILIADTLGEYWRSASDGYLTSEATWRGRFWIPGQPEQEQRGICRSHRIAVLVLTLIGGFDRRGVATSTVWRLCDVRSIERWSVIHGEVGGKPVTLIDCIASHSTSYLMSVHVEEQEVVAERALLGVWINDEDAQVFSAVRIELENLTEWDYRADVVHEIERDQSLLAVRGGVSPSTRSPRLRSRSTT